MAGFRVVVGAFGGEGGWGGRGWEEGVGAVESLCWFWLTG